MKVSVMIWDEKEGEEGEKTKARVLEMKSIEVKELDLRFLPYIALDLGDELIEGMLLETLGRRRSEREFKDEPGTS